MFKQAIDNLRSRFFWRRISFSELSELYLSSMFRNLALSLIGIFVPIYLYEIGYSVPEIFLFLAISPLLRLAIDPITGKLIAKYGPKHILMSSYLFQVVSLLLLLTLPSADWPLVFIGLWWGLASSCFYLAYYVDFASINHVEKEGREIGHLTVLEKIGGALGPLVGGVVATFFGAQYTILASITIFVLAAIPLIFTKDLNMGIKAVEFKKAPFSRIKKHSLALVSFVVENVLSVTLWPFYVAVFIFTEGTYAAVGTVVSASFFAAILSAMAIGSLVDKNRGGRLLKWGVVVNTTVHLTRPFAQGFLGVLGVNLVNDGVNAAYRMPFFKGWYDSINRNPKQRVGYIVIAEMLGNVAKVALWLVLFIIAAWFDSRTAMWCGFVIAAITSLGILTHKFDALKNS